LGTVREQSADHDISIAATEKPSMHMDPHHLNKPHTGAMFSRTS